MLWDPFSLFAEALRKAYQQVVILFEWMVATPLSLSGNPLVDYLNGNALGAAPLLAFAVLSFTMVIALVWKRGRVSFARALLVYVGVAVISPLWYEVTAAFEKLGDDLSVVAVNFIDQSGGSGAVVAVPKLPTLIITDSFLASITFGPAALFAYELFAVLLSYEFVTILVAFFGLLSLGLLAAGARARKVFNFLVAVGLVTMVLGRPVAIICIELGQAFANVFAGAPNAMVITGVITVASLIVAILIQPVLLFLMYQGVSRVGGLIDSRITGTVRSITQGNYSSATRTAVDANISSMNGRSQALQRAAGQGFIGGVATAGIAKGAAKGAAMLAARAAASTTPVGAAVATAASLVVSQAPKLVNSVQNRRRNASR